MHLDKSNGITFVYFSVVAVVAVVVVSCGDGC